jgi:4,5-dihydroxyphthalate decarboxylase
MTRLNLSLAACDYDHLRDLKTGVVRPEGIDLNVLTYDEPHLIFHQATHFSDFDVCELSFGRYVSLLSTDDNDKVALPVFPSRVPRIGALFVRKGSKIKTPEDLKGARMGLPEWAITAAVYAKGWLQNHIGLDLTAIKWFQTGIDQPGRPEPVKLNLPNGMSVTHVPDRSLTDMLLADDIDALITALPPKPFRDGDGRIVRLVRDSQKAEREYFQATGIFPIMHVVAVRKSILEKEPWVALSLYEAFEAAKNNAVTRALKGSHSPFPIPWAYDAALAARALFGTDDFWPYGLEKNRKTIEAFVQFAHQQGVAHRKVTPEELFAPQTLDLAKA